METQNPSPLVFPVRITSPSGLSAEFNRNGSLRRMDHSDIMLNLFLGNEAEGGPANIHLRIHGEELRSTPLLGPTGPASYQFSPDGMTASGEWCGIRFRVRFVFSSTATAWFWHVELENTGSTAVRCDLIHTQDIGLAHYGAIRLNEYYVSQYIDHMPLVQGVHGDVVASRQNQSMGGRCPWTLIGSLGRGVSHATDAIQFHGLATRNGGTAAALHDGLPGKRRQHEHSMVCIQDEQFTLEPAAKSMRGFFGCFEADQPAATSVEDVGRVEAVLRLPERAPSGDSLPVPSIPPTAGLFAGAPFLETLDLDACRTAACFPGEHRHAEYEQGRLLSFFNGSSSHVVLKAKEERVLRPHGHLLRSGGALVPDEAALTSTPWMGGVFHSMVTQGHVSINRFLSTCHGYIGLFRSHGQRVFMETDRGWELLGLPSAFEMSPDSCRWIYHHPRGVIELRSSAPDDRHELRLEIEVLEGPSARFLISHHISIHGDDGSASVPVTAEPLDGGHFIRPIADSDVGRRFPQGGFWIGTGSTEIERTGGDALLFPDGVSRHQPFFCIVTAPVTRAEILMEGRLVGNPSEVPGGLWQSMEDELGITAPAASPDAAAADRVTEIFPWFVHNALVHYLSPRGLEQYSGGGWGTRDVCQGPTELLLSLGRFEPLRDLLCRVFSQQNDDGDWPQWFMFFERERNIRPGDSHGDIVYWPLLALAEYLSSTGDASLLDVVLPYFHPDGIDAAEKADILSHVDRALELIHRRVIPGTTLAAYGHGDWNDSLQPAKPDMRERLCSSWTVTLNYQTFIALADAFRKTGLTERASVLEAMASNILEEFQRVLIADDVLTGLAYFHEGGKTDFMIHPRDSVTGLHYSLLPMIHAIINDMFTPRQAEIHLALIRQHLSGPDGARLFDKPMSYHGGVQTNFQRAESASYFGREIGIMYTHAHIRWCEALARHGDADAFFHGLSQINPIAVREIVASAKLRQANCYFSSSDAAFDDRYEAFEDYSKVKQGDIALEGGWRVYSSGAGISVRLIMQCFLGLRREASSLFIDPVVPRSLDGLEARVRIEGRPVQVIYRVNAKGRGPVSVNLNGEDLDFIRERNAYRPGGVKVSMSTIRRILTDDDNQLTLWLD